MEKIGEILLGLWEGSGFSYIVNEFLGDSFLGILGGGAQNLIMIIIACVLLYLGIV